MTPGRERTYHIESQWVVLVIKPSPCPCSHVVGCPRRHPTGRCCAIRCEAASTPSRCFHSRSSARSSSGWLMHPRTHAKPCSSRCARMPARSDGSSRLGETSGIPDSDGRSNMVPDTSSNRAALTCNGLGRPELLRIEGLLLSCSHGARSILSPVTGGPVTGGPVTRSPGIDCSVSGGHGGTRG